MREERTTWRILLIAVAVPLAVCPACGGSDVPLTNLDGCVDGWQERALPPHDDRLTRTTRRGDVRCVDETWRGDARNEVDVGCVSQRLLDGKAVDHQTGIPFGGIEVEFYLRNVVDGVFDVRRMSNEDGTLANVRLPSCTPIAYVSRGDPDTTLPTRAEHVIFPPDDVLTRDLSSVAGATVAAYANLAGVILDGARGAIFGRTIACDNRVLDGAHVVLRDGACQSAEREGAKVGYAMAGGQAFVDPFALATSDDGSFFVLNAPAGTWVLDMFETTEVGSRLLGSAPVVVSAGGVSLVDIRAGRTDGVRLPDACARCE
jgi:hypothetical protein